MSIIKKVGFSHATGISETTLRIWKTKNRFPFLFVTQGRQVFVGLAEWKKIQVIQKEGSDDGEGRFYTIREAP